MTIQIQQLLFCTAVFVVIAAAGLLFAVKERRESRAVCGPQAFAGKPHADEAAYRVDPVMTKEGVIFVRAGKARGVAVADRVEKAHPQEKIYPGAEESKKTL
jgi:hypothetical protein